MSIKISELPNTNLPYTGNEIIPIVQSSLTSKGTLNSLTSYLSGFLLADTELAQLSGVWQSTYTTTQANSGNWTNGYTATQANSGNWDSSYTTTQANSSNWDSNYTTTQANSSSWDSVYTTTQGNSSNWTNGYTTTQANSGSWDSVYTTYSSASSTYAVNNANNYFTSSQNISGNLDITGDYLLSGTSIFDLLSTATTIIGTANEIDVNQLGTTATISLPNSIVTPGDLNVTGSLFITGSSVAINTSNLSVADSLIYLATSNVSNLLDIGIVGHFTSGYYQHTGLVRNHIDNKWTLFSGVTSEPLSSANTIDLAGPDLIIDTIRANVEGNVTGTSTANLSVIGGTQKNINLITNNISRMTVLSSGNVGIGTSIPNTNLTVVGNISATGNIYGSVAGATVDPTDSSLIIGMGIFV